MGSYSSYPICLDFLGTNTYNSAKISTLERAIKRVWLAPAKTVSKSRILTFYLLKSADWLIILRVTYGHFSSLLSL